MQDVTLGSGELYIKEFAGTMPENAALEVAENKIGDIQGGATVSYKPNVYTVVGDSGVTHKCFVTDSEVTFKSGILTWDNEVLEKISLCGELTKTAGKSTLKLGKRGAIKNYIVRFVHTKDDNKKYRVTIVGTSQNGFELAFAGDKETVIHAEFVAGTLDADGTKLILEEEIAAVKVAK
ncbi:hypothetical protein [uncultured Clostridium sp.]|uniref:hypothetical protein n=1 Tax=uncultured Clostridium sp. TaxID=59620 RepID=UPI002614B33C|nr:hypothetical protein [uncultured Clostridium sp.]